eukprot:6421126-Pyramimonas_sp.AAC.1
MTTPRQDMLLVFGNGCADALAAEAAERGRTEFVIAPIPLADRRDAEAALVRRRARRALETTI